MLTCRAPWQLQRHFPPEYWNIHLHTCVFLETCSQELLNWCFIPIPKCTILSWPIVHSKYEGTQWKWNPHPMSKCSVSGMLGHELVYAETGQKPISSWWRTDSAQGSHFHQICCHIFSFYATSSSTQNFTLPTKPLCVRGTISFQKHSSSSKNGTERNFTEDASKFVFLFLSFTMLFF